MCWKALLLVWQARRRSSVTSAAPTDSDQSGRPLRRAPRALHRTDRALERAQIRACAAWARHDCFCPRAGAGRAIAMATFRWPGSGSPQLGRARACLDRLCVCNGPIPHALASALLPCAGSGCQGVGGCWRDFLDCSGGAWARWVVGACPRTPRLTLVLDAGWLPVGHMMWWGVPADGLRPLSLTRPFPVRGRQQGGGNWPRFIG